MELIDFLIKDGWLKTPRIIDAFRKIKREDFMPDGTKYSADVNAAMPIGFDQAISQPLTVAFMLEKLQPQLGDKILDVGSGSGWTSALLAHIVSQNTKHKLQNTNKTQNTKHKTQSGRIIALEIIPELKEFGEKNASKYGFIKKGIVEFICADATKGWKKQAPYDKILVSASAEELPIALKEQLKISGRIVAPIKLSIWLFIKKSPSLFTPPKPRLARRRLGAKASAFAKASADTSVSAKSTADTSADKSEDKTAGKENDFEKQEFPGFAFVPFVSK